jgi:hypothetical protein
MQLADFMTERELDDEGMAALVRSSGLSCDRSTISRIRRSKSRPSWDLIACFKALSEGRVSADDFLNSDEASAA